MAKLVTRDIVVDLTDKAIAAQVGNTFGHELVRVLMYTMVNGKKRRVVAHLSAKYDDNYERRGIVMSLLVGKAHSDTRRKINARPWVDVCPKGKCNESLTCGTCPKHGAPKAKKR